MYQRSLFGVLLSLGSSWSRRFPENIEGGEKNKKTKLGGASQVQIQVVSQLEILEEFLSGVA